MYNLKGKTAWITGGKRIGQNVAEALAQHGANIILTYNRSKKEAEAAIEKVKNIMSRHFLFKLMSLPMKVFSKQYRKLKKVSNKLIF
ncbi:hypothetical protein CMO83_03020 [Candidatus Woesearchaeota archaeon]|mgnify:CR=1 FL=1|jgi:NAD(P)-dependent dehydrogenase (short-subunit alcohol dehydrogenase family)|nr:hypothetical protein [Candidatus Woesearchaeota archaeon]|tara:strand:+ start:9846 stop:10106 length:261 start_codon:yes stop_codon:yes gene_type:complete